MGKEDHDWLVMSVSGKGEESGDASLIPELQEILGQYISNIGLFSVRCRRLCKVVKNKGRLGSWECLQFLGIMKKKLVRIFKTNWFKNFYSDV